jgi:hypothetical protein
MTYCYWYAPSEICRLYKTENGIFIDLWIGMFIKHEFEKKQQP